MICGLPFREIGESVAAVLGDRADRPCLIECALVQVDDSDGIAQLGNEPEPPPAR
ncbi:MAG: hypothetical protein ACK4GT_17545 [Pararhodobacter sp.]